MDEREIFPEISLFFTQILDITIPKGIILSYQIMRKINKNDVQKMLDTVDIQLIKFEENDQMQLYVLSRFEDDQIWIIKYHNMIILMFSSDY
ncbi:MAG: hypothetical protein HeimC2_01700 [Candidatus Heimdallarchaeota archaeon LC_2]|nr:MAG: hypothetical protein HeimC2_01700 [Candidatus Heimdallarchaeota archaeon LC_2]